MAALLFECLGGGGRIVGPRVLGIDAAGKHGWVGAIVDDRGFVAAHVGALNELITWAEPVATVGVDIPIGNLPEGGRAADTVARGFIGLRRSSVFNAPPVAELRQDSFDETNRQLAERGQPKMSRQTWALLLKVEEAEALASSDDRLIEVHPEVSFRAMTDRDLEWPKKSWNGQMLRRRLLTDAGIVLPDQLDSAGVIPVDDVLDAAAAAWSARRHAQGQARALPDHVEVDRTGHRLAIWY
ncbi:MAG: DUF429 domain-containing protein [Actinomycetia bacterium]|nr:DUF429 domain-containing protein [Actinomycetes bacterium]